VFNTLSSAFDGYTSASSLFWLCGDVFSTLGVMVAGAGFANAQGGKITKIAAWIGVAGIPLGLLALLMYGVAPSLGEGAVYYIVLVVFAVLQVLALALLPLCVVYPLFGKKKPAGPAAE